MLLRSQLALTRQRAYRPRVFQTGVDLTLRDFSTMSRCENTTLDKMHIYVRSVSSTGNSEAPYKCPGPHDPSNGRGALGKVLKARGI